MPSERPTLPRDTHAHMLRRGSSNGLGLQAWEVAYYQPKRRKAPLVAAVAVSALALILTAILL